MPSLQIYKCSSCEYTEQHDYMMTHENIQAAHQTIARRCPKCHGKIHYLGSTKDTKPL